MASKIGSFSLGKSTLVVSLKLHQETRQKVVDAFKKKHPALVRDFVNLLVLEGGKTDYRHDTDHERLFRQESYFHYLFGVKEPDFFGCINLNSGQSYLFTPRLPPEYSVWMGPILPNSDWKAHYGVDDCLYVDEIRSFLKKQGCSRLHVINGKNTDSGSIHHGANFEGISEFTVDKTTIFPIVQYCRVIKTERELEVMRYAARVSAEAHCAVMKAAKPGMMEYDFESLFHHHVYSQSGCRHLSYTCICCTGPNGAILHYGHAGAPNSRMMKDGDMAMLDMGGEYHCYGADISTSFPINGRFTSDQKEIYLSVLAAQQAVMDAMKPGVSWPQMHKLSNRVICEQLKKYNFLKGDVNEMMAHHIAALFMPHGLGHFLGIDTHDVGGYPEGTLRSTEPGLKSLRYGGLLEKNMVLTVEPGIYFISTLLEPALKDPKLKVFLNEEKIRRFMHFGGVRIEDDVIVLENGIENMSRWRPRSIEGIEALMSNKNKAAL